MNPHALEHADGVLTLSELSLVRRQDCRCEKTWDEVPAKDRIVQRDPYGWIHDWACDSCAGKAFDRQQEARLR